MKEVSERMESPPAQRNIDFNVDYLRTPEGLLRVLEAIAALSGIISGAFGSHCNYGGQYLFFIVITVTSFIQSTFVIIMYTLQFQDKIAQIVNLPLTFLLNDTILLFLYFLASIFVMLSIGLCHMYVTARVFASMFSIASFLILVGLVYTDYNLWKQHQQKQSETMEGTTVTQTSPTVLT